jgi:hypothetical protein
MRAKKHREHVRVRTVNTSDCCQSHGTLGFFQHVIEPFHLHPSSVKCQRTMGYRFLLVLFARMTASLRTLKVGVILGSLWEPVPDTVWGVQFWAVCGCSLGNQCQEPLSETARTQRGGTPGEFYARWRRALETAAHFLLPWMPASLQSLSIAIRSA